MPKNPLLKISNVSLSFSQNKSILKDLNLSIYDGDIIVLIGANGSGKSSLIKCINRTYNSQSGDFFILDQNAKALHQDQLAQKITTLGQCLQSSTFLDMSVYENLLCIAYKKKCRLSKTKAAQFLDSLNKALSEKLNDNVSTLSGGQRQILALAMCIFTEPNLFLFDEHTSALDPKHAHEVMALTEKLIEKKSNCAILFTTHDLDAALKYGNRLIALKNGNIAIDVNGLEKKRLLKKDLLQHYG